MKRGSISLSDVRLTLGDKYFVFDRTIEAGTFTAITGPSGAGKSTLFNLLAGFEEPLQGQISIDGQAMNMLTPSQRPISLVFQDNNLFAHLDVHTNIALGISPKLKLDVSAHNAIKTALRDVGLAGFEKRLPGSLSGGERQRVAFARALVRKKSVILLDEPFAAIDSELRGEMGRLLKEMHRQQKCTILMITHDKAEAAALAERELIIDDGRFVDEISHV